MAEKINCKLAYCMCICHVMSCHHYCIDNYKNFLKNSIKYLAGIFTRVKFDKLQGLFFNELFSVVYKKKISYKGVYV